MYTIHREHPTSVCFLWGAADSKTHCIEIQGQRDRKVIHHIGQISKPPIVSVTYRGCHWEQRGYHRFHLSAAFWHCWGNTRWCSSARKRDWTHLQNGSPAEKSSCWVILLHQIRTIFNSFRNGLWSSVEPFFCSAWMRVDRAPKLRLPDHDENSYVLYLNSIEILRKYFFTFEIN